VSMDDETLDDPRLDVSLALFRCDDTRAFGVAYQQGLSLDAIVAQGGTRASLRPCNSITQLVIGHPLACMKRWSTSCAPFTDNKMLPEGTEVPTNHLQHTCPTYSGSSGSPVVVLPSYDARESVSSRKHSGVLTQEQMQALVTCKMAEDGEDRAGVDAIVWGDSAEGKPRASFIDGISTLVRNKAKAATAELVETAVRAEDLGQAALWYASTLASP